MGKRSKVDLYGLTERVVYLYESEKRTLKEIEATLRDEGFDISRESIRLKIKSSREVAETYRQSLDEAKVLLETVKDNPNTDVIEVTNSLLAHHLFRFVKSVEELNFEDSTDFARSVNQLANAQVRVAKLRMNFERGVEYAKAEIQRSVARELDKYPEFKQRLFKIIDGVSIPESKKWKL